MDLWDAALWDFNHCTLQKEIFHLRTTGHIIQGARHRAAALSNCRTTEDSSTAPHQQQRCCDMSGAERLSWTCQTPRHPVWMICPGPDQDYGWQDTEVMSPDSLLTLSSRLLCTSLQPSREGRGSPPALSGSWQNRTNTLLCSWSRHSWVWKAGN